MNETRKFDDYIEVKRNRSISKVPFAHLSTLVHLNDPPENVVLLRARNVARPNAILMYEADAAKGRDGQKAAERVRTRRKW